MGEVPSRQWVQSLVPRGRRVLVEVALAAARSALPAWEASHGTVSEPRETLDAVAAWLREPTVERAHEVARLTSRRGEPGAGAQRIAGLLASGHGAVTVLNLAITGTAYDRGLVLSDLPATIYAPRFLDVAMLGQLLLLSAAVMGVVAWDARRRARKLEA